MENNKENILDEIIKTKKIVIQDSEGKPIELFPTYYNYEVADVFGEEALIPALGFLTKENGAEVPFGVLTKCFGEFIGIKNTAYIDTNNMPFANQFLEMGIAKDTGWTKKTTFWEYPLWEFDERFLKEIGGRDYEKYSGRFDEIMDMYSISNDDEESEDEIEIGMGS